MQVILSHEFKAETIENSQQYTIFEHRQQMVAVYQQKHGMPSRAGKNSNSDATGTAARQHATSPGPGQSTSFFF